MSILTYFLENKHGSSMEKAAEPSALDKTQTGNNINLNVRREHL
jgi:hypothetical protein